MRALIAAGLALAVSTPAAAVVAPSPSGSPAWRVTVLPVAGGTASSFAEPGISAGPAGVLIANASTANSGAPATFWLSPDGGQTWSVGRDLTGGASTGDADALVAADGYRYALNLGYGASPPDQPSNPTVIVYRSPDGSGWAGAATFPAPHGLDQPDRPWLVTRPGHPGDLYVFNSEGGGNIVAWHSVDHGATFSDPIAVTGGANSQAALSLGSRPLVDPADDSRLYLFYATTSATAAILPDSGVTPPYEFPLSQLWLATSADAGQTWANQLVYEQPAGTLAHLLPASAIDSAGHIYVVLSVRTGTSTQTHLVLLRSRDHGASWSTPATVDSGNGVNVMPAVAVGKNGELFVSWYGSAASDFRDPAATWTEMAARTGDALAASPVFSSGPVGGPSPVHLGGIDNAGAIGSDLGANWGLRDFQSIAVDSCGRPHLAWAVDYGGNRAVTATTTAPCPPSGEVVPSANRAVPNTGTGGPGGLGRWTGLILALTFGALLLTRLAAARDRR